MVRSGNRTEVRKKISDLAKKSGSDPIWMLSTAANWHFTGVSLSLR
jgi:hypothetical protein